MYFARLTLQSLVIELSIFLTINSVRSNELNLKYQRFRTIICKDIGIRKFYFGATNKFLFTGQLEAKRPCEPTVLILEKILNIILFKMLILGKMSLNLKNCGTKF